MELTRGDATAGEVFLWQVRVWDGINGYNQDKKYPKYFCLRKGTLGLYLVILMSDSLSKTGARRADDSGDIAYMYIYVTMRRWKMNVFFKYI